jgi:maleylacetate reductase
MRDAADMPNMPDVLDTTDALDAPAFSYTYTSYPQRIVFAAGALGQLGAESGSCGWRRVLLCTTGSQRRAGRVEAVAAALGTRLAAVYDAIQPHVPAAQVDAALTLAAEHEIDAALALGGGSAIGTAKAVAAALSDRTPDRTPIAVAAIPTTYAGSEMTPVYGVTRTGEDGTARKVTTSDARIAPRLILYDPLLTLDLPRELSAGTGINALAHCLETLYSLTRNPLSSAAARAGIRAITHALPRCVADGGDAAARAEMLEGAYLAGTALAAVSMALHHGLCHVLGGSAGVPHGAANAIILPHALRFNAQAAAPQLADAALAMGLPVSDLPADVAAGRAVTFVDDFIAGLGLARRLREVGVAKGDLPRLAALAFQSRTVHSNPRPITDVAQIETLLRAAW